MLTAAPSVLYHQEYVAIVCIVGYVQCSSVEEIFCSLWSRCKFAAGVLMPGVLACQHKLRAILHFTLENWVANVESLFIVENKYCGEGCKMFPYVLSNIQLISWIYQSENLNIDINNNKTLIKLSEKK